MHSYDRYEAVWKESEIDNLKNKDLLGWLVKLKEQLGSDDAVRDYLAWLKKEKLQKPRAYILDPDELVIDLEKADWVRGNSYLFDLNSRLSRSITAAPSSHRGGQALKVTYQGYELGLQIHGRPIAYRQASHEEYADKGIVVKSELVLALGYDAHVGTSVNTNRKRETMLFAPLGYILTKFKPSAQWSYTGLVLIVEIKANGRAGDLHFISSQKGQHDVIDLENTSFDRSAASSDEETKELRKFQSGLTFTLAKLENGFSLLRKRGRGSDENVEIGFTVMSNSSLEVVATGSMTTDNTPSIPFALCPDDPDDPVQ